MTDVYVVRNQLGQFWGKSKAWADGREPKAIMRSAHEDEAFNTLFELSSKDFELRGEVVKVELSEKREPVVEPSEHLIEPAPAPGKGPVVAEQSEQESAAAEPIDDVAQELPAEEPQAEISEEPQAEIPEESQAEVSQDPPNEGR